MLRFVLDGGAAARRATGDGTVPGTDDNLSLRRQLFHRLSEWRAVKPQLRLVQGLWTGQHVPRGGLAKRVLAVRLLRHCQRVVR